jgi:hypothetical protein
MTDDERIARERVAAACALIRSAYRLHPLDPRETVRAVVSALTAGAEDMAADIRAVGETIT